MAPAIPTSTGPVSISVSTVPNANLSPGSVLSILWSTHNAPIGTHVYLYFVGTNGIIPITSGQTLSGTYLFTIPSMSDLGFLVQSGTYKIVANLVPFNYCASHMAPVNCRIGIEDDTVSGASPDFTVTVPITNTPLAAALTVNGQTEITVHSGDMDDGTLGDPIRIVWNSIGAVSAVAVGTTECGGVSSAPLPSILPSHSPRLKGYGEGNAGGFLSLYLCPTGYTTTNTYTVTNAKGETVSTSMKIHYLPAVVTSAPLSTQTASVANSTSIGNALATLASLLKALLVQLKQ